MASLAPSCASRYAHGIEDAVQVHPQLLDVADGNVEYDVHRAEPGGWQDLCCIAEMPDADQCTVCTTA